ncbi:Acyl-CoA N-acyltransferase [Apiospora marii]|uniref:Acyl-CoA N-acyltransferase n=1 Tax=Apiospora marii TaxID=335849 RepID=A0ABR1RWZ6_9PEZI
MPDNPQYRLARATPADIPQLAAISARAFARDANTQMKAQGQRPGAFEEGMAAGLRMWVGLPPSRCVVLKAVDRRGGGILGWVCWGVRGVEVDLPPSNDSDESTARFDEGSTAGGSDPTSGEVKASPQDDGQGPVPGPEAAARIEQFEKMTSDHLAAFQKKIMPDGTRAMYIISAAVDPRAQGLGVGTRLVGWGLEQADRDRPGVLCWVHASEAGHRLFEGQGFAEVERLMVDLDEWAVGRKPLAVGEGEDEGGEAGWGEYTFRYMVRTPRGL